MQIAKTLDDKSLEERAYGNLGNAHYSLGDFKRAKDYYEQQLKIAKELGDSSGEGQAYGNLSNAYLRLGELETAISFLDRELAIAKDMGDRSRERRLCRNLGNTYRKLGNLQTAIGYLKRDLKIAVEVGDRMGEERAYGNLGNLYHNVGDFKTAIEYQERHLKYARQLGDRSGEGRAYGNLGIAHYSLREYKTAIDYLNRSLKITRELGDRAREGLTYGNLGNAHHCIGDSKTAVDYHEWCLKIAKELGDRSAEGGAYGNIGEDHRRLGDVERAIEYHKRHLQIAKEFGDRSEEGRAYGNLGIINERLGDFKTAIEYYEHRLKIAKELGEKSGEGAACCNLGCAHFSLGDFEVAKQYHECGLRIAKELGDRSVEGMSCGNLGSTHISLGDLKTGIEYHKRHLKISRELGDRSGESEAYCNLGIVHRKLEDFKTAIRYLECSLEISKELGDRLGERIAYGNLGNVHASMGDYKTAIDCHKRQLKIAKELGDSLGEAIACSNLGGSFKYLDQVPVAVGYYQLGITLFNDVRNRLHLHDELKVSLRDQYQRIYAELWRLMLAEGKVTEALFSAEQGRAQGLKDLIAFSYGFEMADAESDQEDSTFHEISSRIPLNTIFMAFAENELVFWVKKGKGFELRRKLISWQDEIDTFFECLVEVVGQEIGVRHYVNCEDRSFQLVKDKTLEVERSTGDGRKTQQLHLQSSGLNTLYDIIIEPIQDLLVGSELIFVPEGPLCLASFAAIKGPNSKYLCESFRIRVAPSLTSLKMIADCPLDHHCKSGVLLVGDPWVQEVTELEQLPYAREEVDMIGRMLGCTPLIGRQATKDEVLRRLGSVALVHIAAHGSMETGEIALASNSGEMDFILTMKDVKRVQIRARLVVLSCCHSAHGIIKAEGVVGIARAFLGAGARSVLVSLWAIEDKATLEFMKSFYEHLVKGKSASEALNLAMNCMREAEEFSAVKYWAPFELIGDDVTLELSECE